MEYLTFFNKKMPNDYEIIVIPNNCTDNTVNLVVKLAKKHKQVVFKEFKEPIGKSGALIEGFKLANGDLVGFTDADNSSPPEEFDKLIANLKNFDGVIGSRWIRGANVKLKQPLARRIASRSFNFLIRVVLNLRYRDTQCGCKLFKKRAIRDVLPHLGITKWAFDVDLLYKMKLFKSKINETPIDWVDDPRTHLNLKKAPFEMFSALIRLRLINSPFGFIVKMYDLLPESIKVHHK